MLLEQPLAKFVGVRGIRPQGVHRRGPPRYRVRGKKDPSALATAQPLNVRGLVAGRDRSREPSWKSGGGAGRKHPTAPTARETPGCAAPRASPSLAGHAQLWDFGGDLL